MLLSRRLGRVEILKEIKLVDPRLRLVTYSGPTLKIFMAKFN
jgi:hypothetical protein